MTVPLGRALERFLLPNGCVVCDRVVEPHRPDALVCGVCRTRFRRAGPGCARCHQPLPPVGPCRFCAAWPAALRLVRSAVWLDGTARSVVHHLKYEGLPRLAEEMAEVVVRHVPRPAGGLVLPIPLAAGRQRRRGYNQAAALARVLGGAWRLPVNESMLARARDTGTQTALTPEARAKNVAGAFIARPPSRCAAPSPAPAASVASALPAAAGWSGVAVILVDDVLTTGATLAAATTALAGAGWGSVEAVTFARALPYELRVAG